MARWCAIILVVLIASSSALWAVWHATRANDLSTDLQGYRLLEADVYFPTFFKRYELDRAHAAGWVKSPQAVALNYVGRTRVCSTQEVRQLTDGDRRVIIIVTRVCPYSVAVVRQYRIELIRQDEFWEIDRAGMRLKCAVNPNQLATVLIAHNPLRTLRQPWAASVNRSVKSLADSLNPWMPECP